MQKNELLSIYGGSVSWNSTLFNALVRAASLFLEMGRNVGSATRRIISGKVCSI